MVKVMGLGMRGAMWMRIAAAIGAVILVCAGLLAADQGLQATYSVRGKVVNSVTGEPIAHALVTLSSGEGRSVFSEADGSFELQNLRQAGDASIRVKRPGYFSPQRVRRSQHSTTESALLVTIGPDQPPLMLRLIPEAVIAGRVTGEGGEPIEALPIHILFEGAEDGRRAMEEVADVATDENGEFRKAELPAGRYFVHAGPSEPVQKILNANGKVNFGYGSGFYPGGTDFASASPIDLVAGKHSDLDVRLGIVPFYRVTGTVSGLQAEEGARLEVFDSAGDFFDSESVPARDQGRFHLGPLAAGSYTIEAMDFQQVLYASRPLILKSDMAGVNLTLLPGTSIPVSVKTEMEPGDVRTEGPGFTQVRHGNSVSRTFPGGWAVNITLIERGGALIKRRGRPVSITGTMDEFTLEHVWAGTYEVQFRPIGFNYVQSAVSGSINLLRESLTVAPGASVETIHVVLRSDFGRLEGKILHDSRTQPAIVVAISEESPAWTRTEAVMDANGSYNLGSLAPGRYRVLAVDRIDNFAYYEPETLQRYASRIKEVTIAPNEKANLDLEVVSVGSQVQ